MTRILITSMLLALSFNVTANTDDELKELGIIGQDFKFIDLERATEYFKKSTENYSNSISYKSNDLVKIISSSTTPYYSSVTFSPAADISEAEEKDLADFISTKDSYQVWCKELYNAKYMGVNDHKVEVSYKNKIGETLGSVTLNNETCR